MERSENAGALGGGGPVALHGAVRRLEDVSLRGKQVLIRADLNVPLAGGEVVNPARIDASLPTIRHCLDAGAEVVLMSHLGRPGGGYAEPSTAHPLSLAPVARVLAERLARPVDLVEFWHIPAELPPSGTVTLWENIRFEAGETTNSPLLAAQLAAQCDVFVMDAFGTAHRAHASTVGVAQFAPEACAGLLLAKELDAIAKALEEPKRPVVAIVGGAKVSTKLDALESLASLADTVLVGGGIANTFLLAEGTPVGVSVAEPRMVEQARRVMAKANVPLPVDVMTAPGGKFAADQPARLRLRGEVPQNELILDVGPETLRRWRDVIDGAGTIIWNGPLGVFERDQFGEGTRLLAEAVAGSAAYSIAGGGETLAAIDKYGVRERISYLSTGGGAFLALLEGKPLPAVEALQS